MADAHLITNVHDLEHLFGLVSQASMRKEVDHVHPVYRRWIEASPFAVLATSGPDGLDVSPRGDPAPLVFVAGPNTLLLPERRGNNRIDSLRNILADPRVALLFFIPAVEETLRVQGRAAISVDPALLERFAIDGKRPKCVLRVKVESVFFQCARALKRSQLWQPMPVRPPLVPTAGEILGTLTAGDIDASSYDRDLPERQRNTLY